MPSTVAKVLMGSRLWVPGKSSRELRITFHPDHRFGLSALVISSKCEHEFKRAAVSAWVQCNGCLARLACSLQRFIFDRAIDLWHPGPRWRRSRAAWIAFASWWWNAGRNNLMNDQISKPSGPNWDQCGKDCKLWLSYIPLFIVPLHAFVPCPTWLMKVTSFRLALTLFSLY